MSRALDACLEGLWDGIRQFEPLLFLGRLLVAADQCLFEVLGSLLLNLVEFLLRVPLLLLDLLVLEFDFILLLGEGLAPGRLDELKKLVASFLRKAIKVPPEKQRRDPPEPHHYKL